MIRNDQESAHRPLSDGIRRARVAVASEPLPGISVIPGFTSGLLSSQSSIARLTNWLPPSWKPVPGGRSSPAKSPADLARTRLAVQLLAL